MFEAFVYDEDFVNFCSFTQIKKHGYKSFVKPNPSDPFDQKFKLFIKS